ncbi:hypothetical protein LJC15_05755 [Desulfovibrio sp. OttesenSCG-928-G11]|nr:hypothetical protein [Desulfovibrio sp. OttesenSCG-928-G11]
MMQKYNLTAPGGFVKKNMQKNQSCRYAGIRHSGGAKKGRSSFAKRAG